jgi:hypothetical protein
MIQKSTGSNHSYTVELRFVGKGLQPTDISNELKLMPSSELGSAQIAASETRRQPFWAYNGLGATGFKAEWESLEEGLTFLVKTLSARRARIASLARRFQATWWCGHFQSSFDGGPTLSAKLLTELGRFGVPLSIDNYFSED